MLDLVSKVGGDIASLRIGQHRTPTSDFANHMIGVMKNAEVSAVSAMQGQVPMQDVVMKVMEAERTFAAAMAIRDKAVSAYLEISRMQI